MCTSETFITSFHHSYVFRRTRAIIRELFFMPAELLENMQILWYPVFGKTLEHADFMVSSGW
jgi:hypothetical protein